MQWMRMIDQSRSGGNARNGHCIFLSAVLRGNNIQLYVLPQQRVKCISCRQVTNMESIGLKTVSFHYHGIV